MTSSSSPPNRRRRRIAVVVAVLMNGLGWLLWPRVDQRFVGTWSLSPGFTMTFLPDGTGISEEKSRMVAEWNWAVHDDRLVIHKGFFADRLPLTFVEFVERMTNQRIGPTEVYLVDAISTDLIRARFETRTGRLLTAYEWKRVSP